jgi:hypothetical protein
MLLDDLLLMGHFISVNLFIRLQLVKCESVSGDTFQKSRGQLMESLKES